MTISVSISSRVKSLRRTSSGGGGGGGSGSCNIEHSQEPKPLRPSQRRPEQTRRPMVSWAPLSSLDQAGRLLPCACHLLLALGVLASGGAQEISNAAAPSRAALEAELNNLMQLHDGGAPETSNKLLSEAIISRLMLGNLSDASLPVEILGATDLEGSQTASGAEGGTEEQQQQGGQASLFAPDSLRMRKLMSLLRNYEMAQAAYGMDGGQMFSQYPILPAGQASTIKRASARMGSILKQTARQPTAYGRNNFDFGLGKRPDSSVSSNILRLGDSSVGATGHSVSGSLGKRPLAHRFDFGLGKRVASPGYPRYDFGLGKRAPSRTRYDFGLGK